MEEQHKNRESSIFVWWDVQSCVIPSGYNALRIYGAIKSAMKNLGFCGSLCVEAVIEWRSFTKDLCDRFNVSGIGHVTVDWSIERGNQYMIFSSIDNWKRLTFPRGTVVVVISGEGGYGPILRSLKEAGFVTFSFSKSEWCDVLSLGPQLDPRQYGFAS